MMFDKLFDAIEKQQRVVQWGIYAVAFMAAFMIWSELIEPKRQAWAEDADDLEARIAEVRSAGDLAALQHRRSTRR